MRRFGPKLNKEKSCIATAVSFACGCHGSRLEISRLANLRRYVGKPESARDIEAMDAAP